MADRVERLTNLLALLLETAEPLSLIQIGGELDGQYPDSERSRRAAFERDKAALRSIGVPIEQEVVVGGEYAGQTRYWIDRQHYEVGDIDLADDERRALQVAMAATRQGSSAGQRAVWKLGGDVVDAHASITAVVPDLPALPNLRVGAAEHRSVTFTYNDLERVVDPWGMLLRGGFWYVVGYDHTRASRRTFRVDRIVGDVVLTDDGFERPDGFDISAALAVDPKMVGGGDEPEMARVRVSSSRAPFVARDVGAERVVSRHDDGSIDVSVSCSNLPAFRAWVLGYLEHVEVLDPPHARRAVVDWLEAMI